MLNFETIRKINNTLSAMVPGHFHRVSAKLHRWNLRRSSFCVFQDGGHLGFRTGPKSNNTWSASSQDHSQDHCWRVSTKSHWWNLRRSSKHEVYIGMMIAQHISKWPPYSRHDEFRNDPKINNTLSAMVPGHLHQASTKLHQCNLRRSSFCIFQDGGHLGFRTDPQSNNTWSASSQNHSW